MKHYLYALMMVVMDLSGKKPATFPGWGHVVKAWTGKAEVCWLLVMAGGGKNRKWSQMSPVPYRKEN